MKLAELYANQDRVVITAHRGCSGEFPENTIVAFDEALRINADIIEFDIRGTKDLVPIILHDPTIDRTSNATGEPGDYTFEEIRKFNFSLWHGPGSTGRRLEEPEVSECPIPTFEEILKRYAGKIGMNIQVYDASSPLLDTICRLYREYGMYETGYLSMSTFADAERVRAIDSHIELCVLERQGGLTRSDLEAQLSQGIRFIQPFRDIVNEEFCRWVRELGMCCNMFYSNTDADNRKFLAMGLRGFLTDYPALLAESVKAFEGVY